jgi:hypothetical protein
VLSVGEKRAKKMKIAFVKISFQCVAMHIFKIHRILLMKILKILPASKKPNSTTLKTNFKLLKVVSDSKMIVKKLRLF